MKQTLHLTRRGAEPVAKPTDWVVDLDTLVLADRGTPPLLPGPVTYELLLALIVQADLVVTW